MSKPYMVLETRIADDDLIRAAMSKRAEALVALLQERGFLIRSIEDFDGTITTWADVLTGHHVYRQTIHTPTRDT